MNEKSSVVSDELLLGYFKIYLCACFLACVFHFWVYTNCCRFRATLRWFSSPTVVEISTIYKGQFRCHYLNLNMILLETETRQGQITPVFRICRSPRSAYNIIKCVTGLKEFEVWRLHILDLLVSKQSFVSHSYRKIMRHNKYLTAAFVAAICQIPASSN